MLLERLKQHESDLEALGSSDADYVTTSKETEEQLGGEESAEEAEAAAEKAGVDMAAVKKAATEDAIAQRARHTISNSTTTISRQRPPR